MLRGKRQIFDDVQLPSLNYCVNIKKIRNDGGENGNYTESYENISYNLYPPDDGSLLAQA
jgi:hypothetical protein